MRTPRRIYRDPKGPIGGVAGGFAAYFDVDPVLARLLWAMALLYGIGLPAYLLCWIVIPKATTHRAALEQAVDSAYPSRPGRS